MKTSNIILALLVLFIYQNCSGKEKENFVQQKKITIKANIINRPVIIGKAETDIINIEIDAFHGTSLERIDLLMDSMSSITNIASMKLLSTGYEQTSMRREIVASSDKVKSKTELKGNRSLITGKNVFYISFAPSANVKLAGNIKVKSIILWFSDKKMEKVDFEETSRTIRFAYLLRAAGEDNCNTYRIPGIVTTNRGTLVAIYDNRYNSSTDLQGNIDIGMSRSLDGGQSWSKMQVIMDMGEWGGKPQSENGIGDPSILYDEKTNTIWVAALWFHGYSGQMAWNASKPGMLPTETGQLMLVKSEDDGITWSSPVNITQQIKKPEWSLMFQGPGKGITMTDGTLVFPAQFRDGDKVPHSTIIYSKDNGKTWQIGTGAKHNTTEAQVVQLKDGSLMLNMRDDLNRTEKGENNGRAVATTKDFGKTWVLHPSSNKSLPEPNCMASIIDTYINHDNQLKHILLFSNPNNKERRTNMTIKASLDEGMTWAQENQLEINCDEGYGYSCLTMVDDKNIGILYEGIKDLYFQIIPLKDIIRGISF